MAQTIASLAFLLLLASSARAEPGNLIDVQSLDLAHLAATAVGLIFAIRMANEAFGRRAFPIADTPTFPRYMTSRGQYLLGSGAFVLFACFIFLLLVFLHKEVIQVMEAAGVPLPKAVFEAVRVNETSYLMIIFAMGSVYLFVLRKEASWNVLLWMRDLIQSWISVPQLGHKIVHEIQYALKVPAGLLDEIVKNSVAVSKGDFRKDGKTIDRMWAELSYLRWWILERRSHGDDATFFAEPSFSPGELLRQYDDVSLSISALKAGKLQRPKTAENVYEQLKPIHQKFCRLVACYLLYKNGSRQRLVLEARRFGIPFPNEEFDNPLHYSIIFLLTVFAAVNFGVYGSAVVFDLFDGERLLSALSHQDFDRILNWTVYALSNYGFAIVVVLAVRLLSWRYAGPTHQSRLLTYCWTFVLACAVGPLGLTIVAKCDPHSIVGNTSDLEAYYYMLRWGVGPGLVTVCISYFMDRQLSSELPNIDTSEMFRRVLSGLAFACFTIVVQLPQLLTAKGEPTWPESKLHSVAVGTTFIVTLALALVAQFGLRKPGQDEPRAIPVSTPAE